MKALRLFHGLVAIGLLALTSTASAGLAEDKAVDRMVVNPDAIQLQMMLAQHDIRADLLRQYDWRAMALENLRQTLATSPAIARQESVGKDGRSAYASR